MSIPLAKPPDQRTPFDKGNQWHDWLYKLWTYVQGKALGGTVTGANSEGTGQPILDTGGSTPQTLLFRSLTGAGSVSVASSGGTITVTGNASGTVTTGASDGTGTAIYNAATSTPSTIHIKSLAASGAITLTDSGAGTLTVGGGGTGTVTSVGLSLPSIMAVSGSPVTTSGTLTGSLTTQAANLTFAGPSSGASAVPTFRSLVPADLPIATTTALGIVRADNTTITISGGVLSAVGGGSVSSVALALPTSVFAVSGSPVTTTGTLTGNFNTQAANVVFSGPSSGAATVPTFRALVPADLPTATSSTLGILRPDNTTITIAGGVLSAVGTGAGTVTSVSLGLPVSVFSVTGSPVTSSGTLTGSFIAQAASTVFAGPSTGSAIPTFRQLSTSDLSNGTTGTGAIVLQNSPTLITPALGTPSSGVATNLTGTASGLTAGTVTTNANLTGPITSVGNATSVASQTGTGSTFVMSGSPTITTPNITGTTTGGNAATGSVGEFISATATGVAVTSGAFFNITSISLTAGDWDVCGAGGFQGGAGVPFTNLAIGSSLVSATIGSVGTYAQLNFSATGTGASTGCQFSIPTNRINITTTTTVYLIAFAAFISGTVTASGLLRARRIR